MRKIIMIVLAVMVALGVMGVGYAKWTDKLFKNKPIYTAECSDPFTWVVSNDDGVVATISPYDIIDPSDDGNGSEYDFWGLESSADPGSYPPPDPLPEPAPGDGCLRYTKDVAKTIAYLGVVGPNDPAPDRQYITVEIDNAYPYYNPTVFFALECGALAYGTIQNIVIEEFAPGSTTPDPRPDGIPELTTYYSGINIWDPLPTGGEVQGALHILVEQSAKQNKTYKISLSIETECDFEKECGTAYAYGGGYATCFIDMENVQGNSWGWTNGPLGTGEYTFDIYASAGGCDLNSGRVVGTLTVDYDGDGKTVTVTYSMDGDYEMESTHLYVGNERLPRNNKGDYTVSPGQYPYSNVPGDPSTDTYVITDVSGPTIYVVAHAVVCWFE